MDAQTKNEIIAEITATAAKTIEQIKTGMKQIATSWKKSTKQVHLKKVK